MLTALMVVFTYQYKFVLGPALIIFLAVTLAMSLKYPTSKSKISGLLTVMGFIEVGATWSVAFFLGVFHWSSHCNYRRLARLFCAIC
jgi:hypothetical protein